MFLLSPSGPWQSYSLFFIVLPLFSWCLSVNIYCILEKKVWVIARQDVRETYGRCSFAGFLFFYFFYAIWPCMLSVQCIISQTAIDRATAVLSLCWPSPRHWTYELGYREQHQWVGQRLWLFRKTAIGQLWPHKGWILCQVGTSGLPLSAVVWTRTSWNHKPPFHLLMDMARKYIDLYTYIYIYMCVYVHT